MKIKDSEFRCKLEKIIDSDRDSLVDYLEKCYIEDNNFKETFDFLFEEYDDTSLFDAYLDKYKSIKLIGKQLGDYWDYEVDVIMDDLYRFKDKLIKDSKVLKNQISIIKIYQYMITNFLKVDYEDKDDEDMHDGTQSDSEKYQIEDIYKELTIGIFSNIIKNTKINLFDILLELSFEKNDNYIKQKGGITVPLIINFMIDNYNDKEHLEILKSYLIGVDKYNKLENKDDNQYFYTSLIPINVNECFIKVLNKLQLTSISINEELDQMTADSTVINYKINYYISVKDFDNADKWIEKSEELDNSYSNINKANELKADILVLKEEIERAIVLYTELLKVNSKDVILKLEKLFTKENWIEKIKSFIPYIREKEVACNALYDVALIDDLYKYLDIENTNDSFYDYRDKVKILIKYKTSLYPKYKSGISSYLKFMFYKVIGEKGKRSYHSIKDVIGDMESLSFEFEEIRLCIITMLTRTNQRIIMNNMLKEYYLKYLSKEEYNKLI
jgi:hypothetical protein